MDAKSNKKAFGFATNAILAGEAPNLTGHAPSDVVSPIHLSSTFAKPSAEGDILGHTYSRLTNPTRSALERKLEALESADFGDSGAKSVEANIESGADSNLKHGAKHATSTSQTHAICFASGQAAETALLLSTLKAGDSVLCFDDIYGGTRRLLSKVIESFGVTTKFVDMTDLNAVEKAIDASTKLLWVETPTNPLLQICDLKALAALAKKHGILSVCDNTFASPYLQRPLTHGFDFSLHSMTKYINGHSDSIAGAVVTRRADLYEKLRFVSNSIGAVLSPFDSYLNSRGLKTLEVRMERHCANALEVAKFLESHKKVAKVLYPGLPSHPQHALAKAQMNGLFGGVVCAYLNTDYEGAKRFRDNLDIFIFAESLGGVESLFGMPYFMSHGSVDPREKERLNITKSLFRLSIGIESVEDLKNALARALDAV